MPSHHDSRRKHHKTNTLKNRFLAFFRLAGDPNPSTKQSHHGRSRQFQDENGLREFLEGGERHRREKEKEREHRHRHHHHHHEGEEHRKPREPDRGQPSRRSSRRNSKRNRPTLTLDTQIPNPGMGFREDFYNGVDAITPAAFSEAKHDPQPKSGDLSRKPIRRKPVPIRHHYLESPGKVKVREPNWETYTEPGGYPLLSPRPNKRRAPPPPPRPGTYVKSEARKQNNDAQGTVSGISGATTAPERTHPATKSQTPKFHTRNPDAHLTSLSLFMNSGMDRLHPTAKLPPLPGPPPKIPLPPAPVAQRRDVPSRSGRSKDPPPPLPPKEEEEQEDKRTVSNPFTTCQTCYRNPKLPHSSQCSTCFRLHGGKPNKDAMFRPGSRWQAEEEEVAQRQRLTSPPPHIPGKPRLRERLSGLPPHMPEHRISSNSLRMTGGIGHQDFAPEVDARLQRPFDDEQQLAYAFGGSGDGSSSSRSSNKNRGKGKEKEKNKSLPRKDDSTTTKKEKHKNAKGKKSTHGFFKTPRSTTTATNSSSVLSFACRGEDHKEDYHYSAPPVSPITPKKPPPAPPQDLSNVHPAFRHYYTEPQTNLSYDEDDDNDDGYVSPMTEYGGESSTTAFSNLTTAPTTTVLPVPGSFGVVVGGNQQQEANHQTSTFFPFLKRGKSPATAAAPVPPPTSINTNNNNASVYAAYNEAFLAEEEQAVTVAADKEYANLISQHQPRSFTPSTLHRKDAQQVEEWEEEYEEEYEDDVRSRYNPEWDSKLVFSWEGKGKGKGEGDGRRF